METAIVVFTRDLRVHDNPALALACARAERVVPVFVLDATLTDLAQPDPFPAGLARRPARRTAGPGR